MNRTWTTFTDVDEYLTLKSAALVEDVDPLIRQPGSILNWTQLLTKNISRGDPRYKEDWYQHFQQSPCITVGCKVIGAVESSLDEVQARVPDFVNATRLDTLRWRYRSTGYGRDGDGKSLIDVSRVIDTDLNDIINAHRPLRPMCPGVWDAYNRWPIGIHYYLGDWESFTARNDDLRSTEARWKKWSILAPRKDGGTDDELREWVAGFVEGMGRDTAESLLAHAGELPPRTGNLGSAG